MTPQIKEQNLAPVWSLHENVTRYKMILILKISWNRSIDKYKLTGSPGNPRDTQSTLIIQIREVEWINLKKNKNVKTINYHHPGDQTQIL